MRQREEIKIMGLFVQVFYSEKHVYSVMGGKRNRRISCKCRIIIISLLKKAETLSVSYNHLTYN